MHIAAYVHFAKQCLFLLSTSTSVFVLSFFEEFCLIGKKIGKMCPYGGWVGTRDAGFNIGWRRDGWTVCIHRQYIRRVGRDAGRWVQYRVASGRLDSLYTSSIYSEGGSGRGTLGSISGGVGTVGQSVYIVNIFMDLALIRKKISKFK